MNVTGNQQHISAEPVPPVPTKTKRDLENGKRLAMEAKEVVPLNARCLYEAVILFIDRNRSSRDVNIRWLCSVMEPMLGKINGAITKLSADDALALAAFRTAEIEKEIAAKRKEIANLERDLKSLPTPEVRQ